MLNRLFLLLILSVFSCLKASSQTKQIWIDSVFNALTLDEKIGQLFFVSMPPKPAGSYATDIAAHIKDGNVGGVVFTEVNDIQQATLINQLQTVSKIRLLIGADPKTSLSPSLDSMVTFPSALATGAISNDTTIALIGFEIARQLKKIGIQFTFIPANIFSSDNNDVNYSFGENPQRVASKTSAFWRGLQSGGVLACAKYFPIQGLNISQVQKGVPSVQLSVDSIEVYPFKKLFEQKIPALMPASRDLPMFYPEKKAALKNIFSSSSLSTAFAGDWIRKNMNYNGVFMIDIRNMKNSSGKFGPGEAEVFAFRAGNDVIITDGDVNAGVRRFKRLFKKEQEFLPQLDASVKKILGLKFDAGLQNLEINSQVVNVKAIATTEAKILQRRAYEQVAAIVSNRNNVLPIQSLENKKFICVLPDKNGAEFAHMISKYVQSTVLTINDKTDSISFRDTLPRQQTIIIAVYPDTKLNSIIKILNALKEPRINRDVIVCDFGSEQFRTVADQFPSVIAGFSNEKIIQRLIPQIIFGAIPGQGSVPISIGLANPENTIKTRTLDRLSYSFPEDVGMDSETLKNIDAIAKEAVDIGATPGCNVFVAKDGKVVYEKSFGYLTYEKQTPVNDQTIYDLASVTKVSATLQTTMFMYEKGLIDLNKKASVYLPELKTTNKKDFIIKDILTHQAGLRPFIPFYVQTMKDSLYLPEYYSATLSPDYPYVVADKLFATKAMKDSIWTWILRGKLQEKIDRTPYDYVYSDMSFYMLQHLAEKILNQPLQDFVDQNLYEPLGAYTTGFLPLLRYPVTQIAPTENDKIFRKTLLIGTVHDPGAAMHGGVAGHAGLFSTANDLAKLYQMLLQGGKYGGIQYYKPETVRLFAQKQFESSRRGLGWDRPAPEYWKASTGFYASPKTFGHTGYTGTCVWVDPEFNLLYIFLSNRVHPVVTNKLLSANIRSRIQDVMYESIFQYCKTNGAEPQAPTATSVHIFGGSQ
jgi:beta-N-acetylhexosaminidase